MFILYIIVILASTMASSDTGGVKPFSIAGRYVNERERLNGMTDAERAFRKQWLKDQILSEHEPRFVPELYKETYNPIRRFYRWPLDQLYKALTPALGQHRAFHVRFWTGKALMTMSAIYLGYYYFKYNANDWTHKGGWRVITSRKAVDKGHPEYPQVSNRKEPGDYAARGFQQSPI